MEKIIIKGDIKDVCAYLRENAQAHKGWTVEQLLRLKALEAVESMQFGGQSR